jgi:glyoxylase-like metal-dependent hydrolase (beta-lactamase superfamily II)
MQHVTSFRSAAMRHSGVIAAALLIAGAAPAPPLVGFAAPAPPLVGFAAPAPPTLGFAAPAPPAVGFAPPAAPTLGFAPWIDGTTAAEPETQVQAIDADSFVIRQSVKTNFEAPFLYLLFGTDRALLLDTGSGGLKIRPVIDRLVADWQAKHGNRPIRLTVAHSHSHGDHHAGDAEFAHRPDTDVIGLAPAAVAKAFGVVDWPRGLGRIDLGGRVLNVIPTPGHEPSHIMIHDARTRLLLSGDMLYPGRLYVPLDKFDVFRASAGRLAAFARAHPIRALLGAHIEMTTTPGKDYPIEAPAHPLEHGLALAPSVIGELDVAASAAASPPVTDRHADFIIYPVPARHED